MEANVGEDSDLGTIKVGSKVLQTKDGHSYYGVVERIDLTRRDSKPYYVRWHKGFASWQADGRDHAGGVYAYRTLGGIDAL